MPGKRIDRRLLLTVPGTDGNFILLRDAASKKDVAGEIRGGI